MACNSQSTLTVSLGALGRRGGVFHFRFWATGPSAAAAQPKPAPSATAIPACDKPGGMGLTRIVEIDTTGGPGFGFEHFKQYDFLRDKEVVLTLNGGPWLGNTPAVLKALTDECLKATFFEIGEHARSLCDQVWVPTVMPAAITCLVISGCQLARNHVCQGYRTGQGGNRDGHQRGGLERARLNRGLRACFGIKRLDAQKAAVARRLDGWKLLASYTEVESGRRKARPELAKALCKKHKGKLVVANLDQSRRKFLAHTGRQAALRPDSCSLKWQLLPS